MATIRRSSGVLVIVNVQRLRATRHERHDGAQEYEGTRHRESLGRQIGAGERQPRCFRRLLD